jgi:cytochrome c553
MRRGGVGAAVALGLLAIPGRPAATATIDERLAPCLACHGAGGQSQLPEVPSLGGQPAFYLLTQLVMFRERIRDIAPMSDMLKGASDDDLGRLADAMSKLPPPSAVDDPPDAARAQHVRELVREHRCNFCHEPDLSGYENVPRLAGQREDYLRKSLQGYKDDSRRAYDPQMASVAANLSEQDIADLAYFLARAK